MKKGKEAIIPILSKLGFLAFIGFLLGFMISNIINSLLGNVLVPPVLLSRVSDDMTAIILQIFISGGYGAVCMSGVMLYEIEKWPLALTTAIHYSLVALLFIPVSFFLGWCQSSTEIVVCELVILVVFFGIWLRVRAYQWN